jgi:hypothetical protein
MTVIPIITGIIWRIRCPRKL